MEAEYNIEHAREILEPCGLLVGYLLTDERGVQPAIKRDLLLLTETEGLRWRPARQLQHLPGAPEVKDTPMLPNPFTARELVHSCWKALVHWWLIFMANGPMGQTRTACAP